MADEFGGVPVAAAATDEFGGVPQTIAPPQNAPQQNAQPGLPGRPPVLGLDLPTLAAKGVHGDTLMGLAAQQMKYAAQYQDLTKGQQEITDKNHTDAGKALTGLYYASPQDQQANYAGVRDLVRKLAPDDPSVMPDALPNDPQQAQSLLAMHLGFMGAHESLVANAKSAAETTKNLADAASAAAKTPGEIANSGILQNQLSVIQNWTKGLVNGTDPAPAMIHRMLGFNPEAEQDYQTRYALTQRSGDYKASQDVMKDVTDYAKTNNPTSMAQAAAQSAKVAGGEAAARAGTEVGVAAAGAATQNAFEQQRTVRGLVQTAADDHQQTLGTTGTLLQGIDMARAGNGVAGAGLQSLTAAADVAMFNMRRIPAVASGLGKGGAQDEALSTLDNIFHNVPVNPDKLNQTEAWVKTIANSSASRYNGTAGALERSYPNVQAYPGGKVPRVPTPYPNASAAPSAPQRVTTQAQRDALPSGTVYIGPDGHTSYAKR
jgi:hypothetical protein